MSFFLPTSRPTSTRVVSFNFLENELPTYSANNESETSACPFSTQRPSHSRLSSTESQASRGKKPVRPTSMRSLSSILNASRFRSADSASIKTKSTSSSTKSAYSQLPLRKRFSLLANIAARS